MNKDQIIDWDGSIQNDGSDLVTLPDNEEVWMTVRAVERGHNKAGDTPQVMLMFYAESIAGNGRTIVRDYITMTRKSEWKLCELFRALGLRQHGQELKLRWDLEGMTARAILSVEEYTSSFGEVRQNNKIKKYLEPEPMSVVDVGGGSGDFA